jgi:polyisoprenoid-binding protein YceI
MSTTNNEESFSSTVSEWLLFNIFGNLSIIYTTEDNVQLVKNIDLFKHLKESDWFNIAAKFKQIEIDADDIIHKEGDQVEVRCSLPRDVSSPLYYENESYIYACTRKKTKEKHWESTMKKRRKRIHMHVVHAIIYVMIERKEESLIS